MALKPTSLVEFAGGLVNIPAGGGGGAETYVPLDVVDSTARKALTGLVNGAIVREVGRRHKVTFTYNTMPTYAGNRSAIWTYDVIGTNEQVQIANTDVAGGTSAGGVADYVYAAILAELAFQGHEWAKIVTHLSGQPTITVETALAGPPLDAWGGSARPASLHASLGSVAVIVAGVAPGASYQVIDQNNLSSDAGWQVFDGIIPVADETERFALENLSIGAVAQQDDNGGLYALYAPAPQFTGFWTPYVLASSLEARVIVSDAGTAEVLGEYRKSGITRFSLITEDIPNGIAIVRNDTNTRWRIMNQSADGYYTSTNDAANPWSVAGWAVDAGSGDIGDLPVPTVALF